MTTFMAGKRYAVFSIRKGKYGTKWIRAGSAWVNKDGSFNVYLDALPLDGTLHIREDTKGGPVKEPQREEPPMPTDEEIPF